MITREQWLDTMVDSLRSDMWNAGAHLAAKFVVWQASQYARGPILSFLFVGVMNKDPEDIEHTYTVICDGNTDNDGNPIVTHREV